MTGTLAPIRVLVVDDSTTVRKLLVTILEGDPEITVIGEAANGAEAVEKAAELRPDLITMDVVMPVMDGLEATKEIMISTPTPILIVSATGNRGTVELSLDATQAGALMVLSKPQSPQSERFQEKSEQLKAMVKAMSQVKVVRHRGARGMTGARPPRAPGARGGGGSERRLVAIGASTGGPAALRRILMDLPGDFGAPILVVQHMAKGFMDGLSSWLNAGCSLHVKVAESGESLGPHVVYLAPDNRHLGVGNGGERDGRVVLSDAPPIGGFRPSATHLFESVARACGENAIGLILTGMGSDGVAGLAALWGAGGKVIAQDEATSVVFGMAQEAVRAGVVDAVLALDAIAPRLVDLVGYPA
ncbi:MAG: chemotaxis-specific protein-glutamate methyltransferase CheB [Gemmatimonadaceae bacterium]